VSAGALTHRVANVADLAAIVAIYNDTVPTRMATADLEPVTVDARRAWFAEHAGAARPLWVVEREGQVVAWLSFSTFHPRTAYARTLEISVYVASDWRRHGIGAYLLQAAAQAAPTFGVRTLVGLIFGHNAASLALFARVGYERWGLLPRVAILDEIERDLVLVGRRVATP